MALSARDRVAGAVKSVTPGGSMAGVAIERPDGQTLTSTIARGSADRLELAAGDAVEAANEASGAMVSAG
ncbi:TOBE domain-containing protein [Haloferacaceae archaeon DSL9]